MSHASLTTGTVLLALAAGLALRLFFVLVYPEFDGDTTIYGTLAKNMLLHHAYALDDPFRSTLIRLPGYPVFLAAVFSVFGMGNYWAVRAIQIAIDLASCLLVAGFVADHASRRAAGWVLWLAVLCPFTANYTAVPLTETNSIFCVALGMFSAGRLIRGLRAQGRTPWGYLALTALALCCGIQFRPDGGLLAAAILPGVWWYGRRESPRAALSAALICALLVALPFIPWTIRNYRVFHVFEPLAPRYATDPSELVLTGYMRWTKTWLADYVSSPEVYWRGDDLPIDIGLLPSRAFDSPEEHGQTAKLIADYNDACTIDPVLDARFDALARQRIRRNPLRYYVILPLVRLADMAFRPRTEILHDALPIRWWEWREHPAGSLLAIGYAALNTALFALAFVGFVRRRVPFASMMLAFIALRCLLLLTMENADPRYTLEFFPILLAAAGVALAGRTKLTPGLTGC